MRLMESMTDIEWIVAMVLLGLSLLGGLYLEFKEGDIYGEDDE